MLNLRAAKILNIKYIVLFDFLTQEKELYVCKTKEEEDNIRKMVKNTYYDVEKNGKTEQWLRYYLKDFGLDKLAAEEYMCDIFYSFSINENTLEIKDYMFNNYKDFESVSKKEEQKAKMKNQKLLFYRDKNKETLENIKQNILTELLIKKEKPEKYLMQKVCMLCDYVEECSNKCLLSKEELERNKEEIKQLFKI